MSGMFDRWFADRDLAGPARIYVVRAMAQRCVRMPHFGAIATRARRKPATGAEDIGRALRRAFIAVFIWHRSDRATPCFNRVNTSYPQATVCRQGYPQEMAYMRGGQ
jgi:hypothetical protein